MYSEWNRNVHANKNNNNNPKIMWNVIFLWKCGERQGHRVSERERERRKSSNVSQKNKKEKIINSRTI